MKKLFLALCLLSGGILEAQTFTQPDPGTQISDKLIVNTQTLFGCTAGTIADPGTVDVCPSNFAIFEALNASVPEGGGYTFNFDPGPTGSGATGAPFGLTGPFPTTFPLNNDLNGILSASGLPPFEGEWIVEGVVYSDTGDPAGSVCSIMGVDMSINFLPAGSCADPCDAGDIIGSNPQLVLPGDLTQAVLQGYYIPEGGDLAYGFVPGPGGSGGPGAFNLTGADPVLDWDSDINGVMSGNGFSPLAGTWFIYPISADPDNPDGSLNPCVVGDEPLEVYFANALDCASILDGSSPYFPTDPIFLQVVADNPSCCTLPWDAACEAAYQDYFNGCTYPQAVNYDPLAQDDDSTCLFCEGDANGDGNVDVQDILSVLAGFGGAPCTP